jgi:biotin operon repressor
MPAKGQFKTKPSVICKTYNATGSIKQTRATLGLSRTAVDRALNSEGVKRTRKAYNKGWLIVDADIVANLHKEEKSFTKIAKQLGVSTHTVIRAAKTKGINTGSKYCTEEIKQEAVRLYTQEFLSVPEVANRLGVFRDAIGRHIRKLGLSRTTQEAHALAARDKTGRKGCAGWWQSIKSGKWETADSRYELVRMSQLDADENIETWTKITPLIAVRNGKKYIPDFLITYKDGTKILEEVKPFCLVKKEMVDTGKLEAALLFAEKNGMGFRVITENEIGINTIRTFVMDGLVAPEEQERLKRKKQVDQDYRDKNRERENSRTLAWYHNNREREKTKRIKKNRDKKDQREILKVWSAL